MNRGRPPGSVSVLAVEDVEHVREVDMHAAEPSRALALARALSALPPEIVMVSCEPDGDGRAVHRALGRRCRPASITPWPRSGGSPVADQPGAPGLAAQDEILQVLFWLRGERLAQDASAAELVRFVSLPLAEVEQVLRRLAAVGLVIDEHADERRRSGRGRATGSPTTACARAGGASPTSSPISRAPATGSAAIPSANAAGPATPTTATGRSAELTESSSGQASISRRTSAYPSPAAGCARSRSTISRAAARSPLPSSARAVSHWM